MIKIIPLSEVCEQIVDCPHESPIWRREGVPVIRNFNLVNGQIDLSDKYCVDEETYNKRTRRIVPIENDIIFSREAPIGNCAIIPHNFKCCLGQRLVLLRVNKKVCSPQYLLMVLLSDYIKKQIEQIAKTGSIVSNFNISDLNSLMIPVIDEQEKIATFCNWINTKINNNTQINNNLEELMKTLYQRWFIEFNFPNEDGKPYKASGGKMVYNEELKKNIPENWNTDFISNYCSLISGYAFSSNDYVENGKYKLYTIKNVQDTGIESKVDNYIDNINDDMDRECLLKPSDIIMSLTGNVGRIGIVYDNNALLNQRVLKIKPNDGYYSYIYLLLKAKEMRSYLEKHSNGTSQKNLSPITIEKTKIVIPNEKVIEKFENIIRDYINSYIVNLQQNLKLIDFREFLLPMLMNGQINVDDIKI